MKAAISNVEVAKHLDLDHTTVSRIRAGERHPSMEVMMKIEMWLAWQLADQAVSRFSDIPEYAYSARFEQMLAQKYGEEGENGDATT